MRNGLHAVVLGLALIAAACGGKKEPEQTEPDLSSGNEVEGPTAAAPEPPKPARIRVLHASPAKEAASVAVFLDGGEAPAIDSLAYKTATEYKEVPAGVHQVAIKAAAPAAEAAEEGAEPAAPAEPILSGQTPELVADRSYTIIAHGLPNGEPPLAITATEDALPTTTAGQAYVRLFHALAGVDIVDVCLPGATKRDPATPVFTGVAYGSWGTPAGEGVNGSYAAVPAGQETKLQLRAPKDQPCAGKQVGSVTLTPPDGGILTAVAIGKAKGKPAKELLVCPEGSPCTEVAIKK